MAPHLNVSVGATVSDLRTLHVNRDAAAAVLSTPYFRGRIAVRIKHFSGDVPEGTPDAERSADAPYFDGGHGKGMTWSIQMQGRFRVPDGAHEKAAAAGGDGSEDKDADASGADDKDAPRPHALTTDDLVFGNEFDRPIRDRLPWGTSVALEAAKFIDPNLEHDLYADKPWAYSPFVATMTRISAAALGPDAPGFEGGSGSSGGGEAAADADFARADYPPFPSPENASGPAYVSDDLSALIPEPDAPGGAEIDIDAGTLEELRGGSTEGAGEGSPSAHRARARWFGTRAHRQSVRVEPRHVLTADFCNAFVDFNTLRLELPYTGGMGFDLKKYWDGQPVRYVCKDRRTGTLFFVVQFNIVDKDA